MLSWYGACASADGDKGVVIVAFTVDYTYIHLQYIFVEYIPSEILYTFSDIINYIFAFLRIDVNVWGQGACLYIRIITKNNFGNLSTFVDILLPKNNKDVKYFNRG